MQEDHKTDISNSDEQAEPENGESFWEQQSRIEDAELLRRLAGWTGFFALCIFLFTGFPGRDCDSFACSDGWIAPLVGFILMIVLMIWAVSKFKS